MRTLRPFIKSHIKQSLKQYQMSVDEMKQKSQRRIPFDSFVREYFKSNKTLGPSERSIIAESLYKVMKNLNLYQYIAESDYIEDAVDVLLQEENINIALNNPNIPFHVRCSCPKNLFEIIAKTYGQENAYDMLQTQNQKAPLTIRANPIKTNRNNLLKDLRKIDKQLSYEFTKYSPYGITFLGQNQFHLQETQLFKDGLFEIQDEASQICALRVECQPKQKVLDFCAGSGGKTLAFAHQMDVANNQIIIKNTGLIVLHDVRQKMLEKAKQRCARAGIQNYQLAHDTKEIQYKFDWVIVDVPCSGMGTLRRNPDLKIYFDGKDFFEQIKKQQRIFETALNYLKPDGKIVYITCSFMKEENEDQIQYFCKKFNLKVDGAGFFKSLPKKGQMDSFFSATLTLN